MNTVTSTLMKSVCALSLLALPAIALCYMLFTLDSALQFARGKGGLWKGRVQALEP